jgi:hypothetical protein
MLYDRAHYFRVHPRLLLRNRLSIVDTAAVGASRAAHPRL